MQYCTAIMYYYNFTLYYFETRDIVTKHIFKYTNKLKVQKNTSLTYLTHTRLASQRKFQIRTKIIRIEFKSNNAYASFKRNVVNRAPRENDGLKRPTMTLLVNYLRDYLKVDYYGPGSDWTRVRMGITRLCTFFPFLNKKNHNIIAL